MPRRLYSIDDARRRAKTRLPRMMFDFIEGAASDESLATENSHALDRIRLMPRVLIDVSERDLASHILGQDTGLPFGIAPMGMCALSWPDADRHMARIAAQRHIPLCVSTAASASLETIIEAAEGNAWFQLYADQSTEFVDELVARADACGYSVLVLTVDVPIPSVRIRDRRNGFSFPMKWTPRQVWDLARHPYWSLATLAHAFSHGTPRPMNYATSKTGTSFVRSASRSGADWGFLERLRERWKGKLVVKGVQCPEDAQRIASIGADALYVSNHGGRQLNAAPTSIDSLRMVRAAVGKSLPLIFDGGVRNGEHIIKAIASGANFVMIGRSALYGLGAAGSNGLERIVDLLVEETSATLGLIGHTRITEVSQASLATSHGHQQDVWSEGTS